MSDTSSFETTIMDVGVLEMNRLPDFGLIEGRVRLLLRRSARSPLEKAVVITNVATKQDETLADLRLRLAADAVRLWHLSQTPARGTAADSGAGTDYSQAA